MEVWPVSIVLFAALMHALWNSMMKVSADKLLTLGAIRLVGLAFGLAIVFSLPLPDTKTFLYLLGSSIVFFIYYFFLLNAYRVGDFSQVYPIARGTAPLIVLGLGVAFAGDSASIHQSLAVLLISVGVLSLSVSRGPDSLSAVAYALGTAMAIAGYTLLSGMGVRHEGSFLVVAGYLETFTGIGVLSFIAYKRKYNPIRRILISHRTGVVAGAISVFGYASALWAMTIVPIATVAALRETSIIFAGLIGTIHFKEGHGRVRVTSACIVALGVILLGLKA